ncbi:MAG TPA: metal-sulfur cluster assembly factor [Chitinophagaceae bacterium]|nr:metal-sulfur cluster assembly factor [Chitinophagaceae bacterium]
MNVITNNDEKYTAALQALENVMDPEIGLNVVDLGLIYELIFDESAKTIHVKMTLTTQFCPMGESIANSVQRALENIFPGDVVMVETVFDPPWNFEMISDAGRQFLKR